MVRKRGPHRFKARMFAAGTLVLLLCIVSVVLSKLVALVRCLRFEEAFAATAASRLYDSVDVAAIASARTAVRDLASADEIEEERVSAWIERRWPQGRPDEFAHVVAFETQAESCRASYVRSLGRRLSAEELRALAQAGVHECDSCELGRHHEHRGEPVDR